MRRAAAGVVGVVLAILAGRPASGDTFSDVFRGGALEPVGMALGQSVARSLPVSSASPGVTYEFDVATGAWERRGRVLGQLFLERAEPLGPGRWDVTIEYQHVSTDSIDGRDLGDLRDTTPLRNTGLRIPRFDVELTTEQVTASTTYGLTPDLDVNLTVPMLDTRFALDATFEPASAVHRRGSKLGPGDVLVRFKDRFLHGEWGDVAAGLGFRLPSGSAGDFQGTGDVDVAPTLIASSPCANPSSWLELQGFFNGGIDIDASDTGRSEGRWGVGADARLPHEVSVGFALLARHPFERIANLDFPRADGTTKPLFGLQLDRPNIFDFAVSSRVAFWRDTLAGLVSVVVPLNGDGVRASPIPLIGLEATF